MARHIESQIQRSCVQWFRYQFSDIAKLLFAVPNGEKREKKLIYTRKGPKMICPAGKRLKAEGQTSGVADLILLIPKGNFSSLCIEMKTDEGSQSANQKDWQQLAEKWGNKYVICRSLDDFMREVKNYLLS